MKNILKVFLMVAISNKLLAFDISLGGDLDIFSKKSYSMSTSGEKDGKKEEAVMSFSRLTYFNEFGVNLGFGHAISEGISLNIISGVNFKLREAEGVVDVTASSISSSISLGNIRQILIVSEFFVPLVLDARYQVLSTDNYALGLSLKLGGLISLSKKLEGRDPRNDNSAFEQDKSLKHSFIGGYRIGGGIYFEFANMDIDLDYKLFLSSSVESESEGDNKGDISYSTHSLNLGVSYKIRDIF